MQTLKQNVDEGINQCPHVELGAKNLGKVIWKIEI